MTIQLATRVGRSRNLAASAEAVAASLPPVTPQVPARRRRPAPPVPVEEVAEAPRSNSSPQFAEIEQLMQDYAVANAEKNRGTREEKKAKDALNERMVALEITSHAATVTVDGALLPFEAKLATSEEEYFDMATIRSLCPDEETFMSIISVTKAKVEEVLGKNALLKAKRTRTKPASLSVGKVK